MNRPLTALLLLIGTWCPLRAAGEDDACREGSRIARIQVDADAWVDVDATAATAGLAVGDSWRPAARQLAVDRLAETQLFRSVAVVDRGGGADCLVEITLDRKPTVSSVELRGVDVDWFYPVKAFARWITRRPEPIRPPGERQVRRLLGVRAGTLFEPQLLDRGSRRILERFDAAGFGFAQVAMRTETDQGAIRVIVEVDAGPPIVVAQIAVAAANPEVEKIVSDATEPLLGVPRTRLLARDTRRRIVRELRAAGYYQSRVTADWRYLEPTERELTVEVDTEGQREIVLEGNHALSEEDLVPHDELLDRVIFTANTWRQLARQMRQRYQAAGFVDARVDLDAEDAQRVVFTIDEGERYRIEAVEFRGNRSLDDGKLADVVETGHRHWLPLRAERNLEDGELVEDVDRLRFLYSRNGFESAEVTRELERDEAEGSVVVVFQIDEGPRTVVRKVVASGVAGAAFDNPLPQGFTGEPYDPPGLESARRDWEGGWRRGGYRDARVRLTVEREAMPESAEGGEIAARVSFDLVRGPLSRVGRVRIEGNSEVEDRVIARSIPFAQGDPVSTDQMLEAQRDVYGTGVFSNVSVSAEQARPAEVDGDAPAANGEEEIESDVVVAVAAKPPGRLRYGVGYDSLQGFTGFGELTYANLNHRAQQLRVRGQLGFDPGDAEPTQYLLGISFSEPALRDGPFELHLNTVLERNTRTIDQYDVERLAVGGGIARQLSDALGVGLDLQVEHTRIFDVLPVPFLARDEQSNWATVVAPFLLYDGRDNPFNPRSGFLESVRLRYALPGLSEISLVEIDVQHTHLIPLWWDWVFVYSLRVGWVRSLDGDPIVPIRRRYFVGGGESVRGFVVNSLGPYDGAGNEVGGDLALIGKSELRIPIYGALGLVLFVDGGGNYLSQCDSACRAGDPDDPLTEVNDAKVSLDNFRTTAGVGLRYVTPVGPISVDYGLKLDRRTRELADGTMNKESFGEFSVSIGATF